MTIPNSGPSFVRLVLIHEMYELGIDPVFWSADLV
jgi:hypothetical protein